MNTLTALLALLILLGLLPPAAPRTVHVDYTPATAPIANPERGFYHYLETRASAPAAYAVDALRAYRTDAQITLLYCINYLDGLTAAPIPQDFLDHIAANLAAVRAAGLKCVLRFAYTDADPTTNGEQPPFGDAPPAQVAAHLEQLGPLLQANTDVIALIQAGFIGAWGEWYYTDHFVEDPAQPWAVSDAMYALRRQVIDQELSILPPELNVAVRYVEAKQRLFADTAPLTPTLAFSNTRQARTGFHNDCFLASDSDFGTYRADQIETDKTYLAAETQFTPMGGETCNPNPPRSACDTALVELERFHWTYLNTDYHPAVLAGWAAEGCRDEIARRLGYRLRLVSADLPATAFAGGALPIQLDLENVGFAAPINPRPVVLVLRREDSGATVTLPLTVEVRRWLPGAHTILASPAMPADLPPGVYELLLHLPDPHAALADRPEYAIQFANVDTWEPATGYNNLLHTVTITAPPGLYLPAINR